MKLRFCFIFVFLAYKHIYLSHLSINFSFTCRIFFKFLFNSYNINLLGLDDIDISSERHLDGDDLLNMLNGNDKSSRIERSSSSTSSLSSVILPPIRGELTSINYYFLIAALIALLSFVIYLLMKTMSS